MVAVLGVLCVAVAVEKTRRQQLCSPVAYLTLAMSLGWALILVLAMIGVAL